MSGTSLDGLDVALCKISGSGKATRLKLLKFITIPYTKDVKERIREIFAKIQIKFLALSELNAWIGVLHGKMVLKALKRWRLSPKEIDIVASHGQTVFHSPKAITKNATINSTFQVGDGDHLAVTTGIITVSDFRQKHVASGGEGAPLAVYGDHLLFGKKGESRIMLNIGGIGNFTFLPSSNNPSKVFVTDTGPGNTLIDQTIQRNYPNKYFDKNSEHALRGKVNSLLLSELKAHPFFKLPFPKTTGIELFNLDYVNQAIENSNAGEVNVEDVLATLTRFSAETISEAIIKAIGKAKVFHIYVSGGGAHNLLLMSWIKEMLPHIKFHVMDELGISGDAKEAVLFAVLANETISGGKLNFGGHSKIPSITMGKISFPG